MEMVVISFSGSWKLEVHVTNIDMYLKKTFPIGAKMPLSIYQLLQLIDENICELQNRFSPTGEDIGNCRG